ncbi:MAG: glycosyltransferase [Planctomycetes bacterium]|nr:glycosyltransferase [Planctomycetota bacterium]
MNNTLRICFISKYPPIEGGESAKAYWLAKALGEKGHEVHIVTNAWEVESSYREQIDAEDLSFNFQPKNVHVHNTDPFIEPAYIPYSKPYTEKIASLAIDIIKEYDLQLIDSWYILPYVISGFLAKTLTGKPQIMRHAGSDMSRLLSSPYLGTLFTSIFGKVDKIVTYPSMRERFLSLGIPEEKLFYNTKVSIDTKAFNPEVKPIDLSLYTNRNINLPIITYIGKTGITKGIYELAEASSKIKDDFLLLFVSKGRDLDKFKETIKKLGLQDKTLFIDFVPPWKIPSIIKRSTCVLIPERDFPVIQHTPILPREVMAVGKCMILSNELYAKRRSPDMQDEGNLITVDPKNIEEFKGKLEKVIKQPEYAERIGKAASVVSKKIERFDEYVEDIINLYKEIIQ